MSRLDWFTIVLVTLLLGALGFLIYRTVQLIQQDDSNAPKTELRVGEDSGTGIAQADNAPMPTADEQDLDDDELTYDPQEIEAPSEKETSAVERKADTKTNTAAAKETTPKPEPAKAAAATETTTPKGGTPTSYNSGSSSTGDYLVVAGSFSLRHNADNQVSYLKELGYNNAQVEMTRGGALASAMVGRFTNRNSAQQLVDELKRKGVDAIVKKAE